MQLRKNPKYASAAAIHICVIATALVHAHGAGACTPVARAMTPGCHNIVMTRSRRRRNAACSAALVGALEKRSSHSLPRRRSSLMNQLTTLFAAAAVSAAAAIAPAAAQNLPPPGNVNPGSMQSGAEETGAENQPRSYEYAQLMADPAFMSAPVTIPSQLNRV
jgi:hypothetical protein